MQAAVRLCFLVAASVSFARGEGVGEVVPGWESAEDGAGGGWVHLARRQEQEVFVKVEDMQYGTHWETRCTAATGCKRSDVLGFSDEIGVCVVGNGGGFLTRDCTLVGAEGSCDNTTFVNVSMCELGCKAQADVMYRTGVESHPDSIRWYCISGSDLKALDCSTNTCCGQKRLCGSPRSAPDDCLSVKCERGFSCASRVGGGAGRLLVAGVFLAAAGGLAVGT